MRYGEFFIPQLSEEPAPISQRRRNPGPGKHQLFIPERKPPVEAEPFINPDAVDDEFGLPFLPVECFEKDIGRDFPVVFQDGPQGTAV